MRRQNCCRPQATGTRLPACSTLPLVRADLCLPLHLPLPQDAGGVCYWARAWGSERAGAGLRGRPAAAQPRLCRAGDCLRLASARGRMWGVGTRSGARAGPSALRFGQELKACAPCAPRSSARPGMLGASPCGTHVCRKAGTSQSAPGLCGR